jgi:hypothetical protein
MKNLTTAVILLLITTCNFAFAQKSENSSKEIFAKFPVKINISQNLLSTTMNAKSGESVAVSFNQDFIFNGVVLSNEKVFNNLQTVIIKSPAFDNALFQLSKITNPNQTESYVGRIINVEASDAYLIAKDESNNYLLEKIELKSILQDCSL